MALTNLRRKLAIGGARSAPHFLKDLVHRNRILDSLSRRFFRRALGADSSVPIQAGPLSGLRLAVSDHISHAHITGAYEQETTEALASLVQPGYVCYDLGASIGYLSLLMARKAKHVFCFEPAPHAAREISRNMSANGFENFTVISSPVTDEVREVRFAVTDTSYGSGIIEHDTKWPEFKVTSTTLDRFIRDHSLPDFVKIDVEGEEDRVLAGARELLAHRCAIFFCELHRDEDVEQCRATFDAEGYSMTAPDGEPVHWDRSARPGEFHIVAYPPPRAN